MTDYPIKAVLILLVLFAAIAFSSKALPKTPRYWLRILFGKEDNDR